MESTVRNILVIEDDPGDVEILRRCLEEVGGDRFEIQDASTADAAFELMAQTEFDLIFVDYQLGALTGANAIVAIRGQRFSRPIIAMTGRSDPYTAAELMRAGADDYLAKADLDTEKIAAAIERSLQRRRSRYATVEMP